MKNLLLTTILLSSLLIPSVALSAPDKYTKYLIETPISIHDFAIYQMEVYFDDSFDYMVESDIDLNKNLIFYGKQFSTTSMGYNYNKDEYTMYIMYAFLKDFKDKNKMKEIMKDFIVIAKRLFYVDTKDNKHVYLAEGTQFSRYLTNQGYQAGDKPKDLGMKIDEKINISVRFQLPSGVQECTSKLMSTKVMCAEKKVHSRFIDGGRETRCIIL